MIPESITLAQLNQHVAQLVTRDPKTQNVWVTAELSDVAVRRGHCYMELLQKDDNGNQVAKARGVIWAGNLPLLRQKFFDGTGGQQFASGIKLMLKVSVSMHPVFGMSLVITDLDPNYTMGDLLRRRREIVDRLTREGVIEDNRRLQWPAIVQRIAVISAPGAAGYGDFINQLMHNQSRLRFYPRLFPAVMQGERAAVSIIEALDDINAQGNWDCVVIIRGGGATSDLQCFEDYNLALNIACFSIPVIIGIGHERDVTLLDYVANMRVKTPTAAAEWLIGIGDKALAQIDMLAQAIATSVSDLIAGCKEQLSYYNGLMPVLPRDVVRRASLRLGKAGTLISGVSAGRLAPARSRLDVIASTLANMTSQIVVRNRDRLAAAEQLLAALSPQAVLNRGYSITRVNGKVVTDPGELPAGALMETTLSCGTVTSVVENIKTNSENYGI